MVFWRLRALLNSVLALHAVAEWLDGFLVPRSYQRESRCRWLALPCALHAVAASDAPPDTPETVSGESSDDGRQRPTASADAGVPLPASSDAGVPSTASGDAGVPSTASGDAGVPSTASGDAGVPSMASGDAGVPLPASGDARVPLSASGGSAVGSDFSLSEKLELTRDRKHRIKNALGAAKCRWSSADSYVRYRTAQRRCRASRADAPVEPSPYEQERIYRERYKEVERAQLTRIERLRATLASVEQEERELLAAINRQTADATAGDTTEGEPGPSTSMARSQGPAAQILPEVPGVSMEVAASDSSSDDGSIASSPSGKASSAEVAATHSTTAASSGHASRVQAPADKLSLIRARKSSLLVRLGDLKRVWKSEEAYVQSRRRSRNSLRALRGSTSLQDTEVTPEERVRYSRLYREGVADHIRRAEEMRRQIQSLTEEEQQIVSQLRRASSDGAERGATEGQGSSVGGAVIPDVASGLDDPDGRRTAEQVPFSEPTAPHERGAATVRSVEPAVLLDASLSSMPQPDVGASTCLLTTSMGDAPGYDGPPLFGQVAAAGTAAEHSENDIPLDVIDFVLSHTTPSTSAGGDITDPPKEPTWPCIQAWSPPYSPPPIMPVAQETSRAPIVPQPGPSAFDMPSISAFCARTESSSLEHQTIPPPPPGSALEYSVIPDPAPDQRHSFTISGSHRQSDMGAAGPVWPHTSTHHLAPSADAPRPTRYGPPAAIELQPSLHLHAPSDSRAALMLTTLVPPSDPYEPASAFLGHFPGASTGSHSQLSWAHQTGQSGHSPASADDNGTPSTIAPQHGTGTQRFSTSGMPSPDSHS